MFDLLHGVGEEDGGVWVRGTHLRLRALQSREERRVEQGRLVEAQARGDVSGHAEIWVLEENRGK